jgi:hypothetical protein
MRISTLRGWVFLSSFQFLLEAHAHDEEVSCTHGKLFLSDTSSSQIHVIDLNVIEPLANLTVETTVTVDGGPGGMALYSTSNGKAIATLYGGSNDMNYTDGVVNWIHTGLELINHSDHSDVSFKAPTVLSNGTFRCAQAAHFATSNNQVAVFCDGSYSGFVNSSVWCWMKRY